MDLFSPRLVKKECKYSIHNDNSVIHLPSEKKKYKFFIYNNNCFILPPTEKGSINFNSW